MAERAALAVLLLASAAGAQECPPGARFEDEAPEIRALGAEPYAKHVLPGCPVEGCAGDSEAQRALNRRKGRSDTPSEERIDRSVTLARVLAPSPDDRKRFTEGTAVRITGFVRSVWQGGVESANCRTLDLNYRDTHIAIYATESGGDRIERMILEVTPRTRALAATRGADWSTEALAKSLPGRWIEATGWMFFDTDHCNETANTREADDNCGGPGNGVWRRTGWEVHPLTSLRILERTPPQ